MEPTQIINDVNKTLYKVLRSQIDPAVKIVFGSPADEESSSDKSPKLYIFLYNVVIDPHFKNANRKIIGGDKLTIQDPPLPLNLHYLMVPESQPVSGTGEEPPDGVAAHLILAQLMTAFNENSSVHTNYFPDGSSLAESGLVINHETITMDDLSKLWGTFEKPFQLSVAYEVSIVNLQTTHKTSQVDVVTKLKVNQVPVYEDEVSIPIHDKVILNYYPQKKINSIVPSRIQAGMPINVHGRGFNGKNISIMIDDKILDTEFIAPIAESLIKLRIPKEIEPGRRQLSIKIDGEELFSEFEIVPSSSRSISITDITPTSGKSGDMILINGINFDEGLSVVINEKPVSKITLINSSQFIMQIPDGVKTGPAKIIIKKDKDTVSRTLQIV
jgi:hypothetical protein